jgi:hypothetical protein
MRVIQPKTTVLWKSLEFAPLRISSLFLGLIWGFLGVVIHTQANLSYMFDFDIRMPMRSNLMPDLGVVLGMMFGVWHASAYWLKDRQFLLPGASWISKPRISLAFSCLVSSILAGVMWGTVCVAAFALVFDVLLQTHGLFSMWLLVPLVALGGLVISVFTVLPASLVMLPITLIVWEKAIERSMRRDT